MVLDDARVSWRHATISWSGRSWVIEDHGSTNGTYVQGQRIHQTGDRPRLGRASRQRDRRPAADAVRAAAADAAARRPQQQPYAGRRARGRRLGPAAARRSSSAGRSSRRARQQPQPAAAGGRSIPHAAGRPAAGAGAPPVYGDRSPTTFHQFSLGRVMRIGRALENELVVSDLQVSRHHAEFRATPDGRFEIRDLGCHNGTYVNGQPIAKGGSALLGPNDIVGVGHSTFRLVGDRLEEFVDTGEVSFSARHLTVTVDGGKQILKDVSFGVPEKSLIAVIGPSGSGKSTLLKALTGYRPANQGDVLYDNRNLYKQFAELRQRIGLVPQDDILHKELTVQKALQVRRQAPLPRRHRGGRARGPDRRGAARAQARHPQGEEGHLALRRSAQARLGRPGAAHQAVADLPGRADLRPRPGHGPRCHAAAARPRRRRPHGPGRHPLGRRAGASATSCWSWRPAVRWPTSARRTRR